MNTRPEIMWRMKESLYNFPVAGGIFSDDRQYRYVLWRKWDTLGLTQSVAFICLNPSTADETKDDPTIRRCIGYAKSWGFGGLFVCNLFAFCATNPTVMKKVQNPIGNDNDIWMTYIARNVSTVIAGWGEGGNFMSRDEEIKRLIPNLHYLKLNKSGQPAHPLYLKKDLTPMKF